MTSRIVVVGAGITGLAAAHRVCERSPATEVLLLDAATRASATHAAATDMPAIAIATRIAGRYRHRHGHRQ